ncbi:MAG: SGNH/GDSL hydrolase family protein [Brachymonas sp.]
MIASRFSLSRRQALNALGAAGTASLLAACGSGSTFEPLVPTRFVSFGDGWSDLGQTAGGNRFTVNDGSTNVWVAQLAARYGKTISAQAAGGLGYAQGGARIDTAANSMADQITAFLADNSIGSSDVLVLDAGISELLALAGSLTGSALNTAADLAGKALATQARRLTAAGCKRLVLSNTMDAGKTPFATAASRTTELSSATRAFNDALKIALADVSSSMLLIDTEAYVNLVHTSPTSYLGSSGVATGSACPSGTFNTTTCTTANANTNYNSFLFADDRHPTPAMHRLIGDNAYSRVKARW